MATLQSRFILVAFTAMAAVITYNATYLQTGPQPGPVVVKAPDTQAKPVRTARLPRKPGKTLPEHVETTASLPRSKTVAALQRKLAETGYEPGPADGVQGHMTMAAIMAYQHDNGLRMTGIASNDLLKHMLLGSSVGENREKNDTSFPEESKAFIKTIQKALTRLGYDAGPPDGLWGNATRKAIEKFERDRKLEIKGRVSGRFMKELLKASGGSLTEIASG